MHWHIYVDNSSEVIADVPDMKAPSIQSKLVIRFGSFKIDAVGQCLPLSLTIQATLERVLGQKPDASWAVAKGVRS